MDQVLSFDHPFCPSFRLKRLFLILQSTTLHVWRTLSIRIRLSIFCVLRILTAAADLLESREASFVFFFGCDCSTKENPPRNFVFLYSYYYLFSILLSFLKKVQPPSRDYNPIVDALPPLWDHKTRLTCTGQACRASTFSTQTAWHVFILPDLQL
jgi:hypothetical protein